MKKTKLIAFIFIMMFLYSITGLYAGGTQEKKKVITLSLWEIYSTFEAEKRLYEDFTKSTGIQLDIVNHAQPPVEQTVITKWNGGERPDILEWQGLIPWMFRLRFQETWHDLSDMKFVKNTAVDVYKYTGSWKGRVYGVTLNYPQYYGVFYNREVFRKVGIQIPESMPKGYREFFELCKKLKSLGITPLYQGGGDQWPLQLPPLEFLLETLTTNIVDELNTNKTDWTDPRMLQAIEKFQKMLDAGFFNDNILTATYEEESRILMDGKAAMVMQGSWYAEGLVDTYGASEVDEKIGLFPISETDNYIGLNSPHIYVVPKTGNAEKEAAARKFIEYITGPRYQAFIDELKIYPLYKGFQTPAGIPRINQDADKYFKTERVGPGWDVVLIPSVGPIEVYLQEMVGGRKTSLDVAKAVSNEFLKSGKEFGLPGY